MLFIYLFWIIDSNVLTVKSFLIKAPNVGWLNLNVSFNSSLRDVQCQYSSITVKLLLVPALWCKMLPFTLLCQIEVSEQCGPWLVYSWEPVIVVLLPVPLFALHCISVKPRRLPQWSLAWKKKRDPVMALHPAAQAQCRKQCCCCLERAELIFNLWGERRARALNESAVCRPWSHPGSRLLHGNYSV